MRHRQIWRPLFQPCVSACACRAWSFVTVINQGDYLIEIPVERKDIPRVCYYQVMHMGSSADIEGGSSDLLGDIHTCRSFLDIYQAQSCHAL